MGDIGQTGRYGSASEVVCAGLRLLEEHEDKVAALQNALIEGEQTFRISHAVSVLPL